MDTIIYRRDAATGKRLPTPGEKWQAKRALLQRVSEGDVADLPKELAETGRHELAAMNRAFVGMRSSGGQMFSHSFDIDENGQQREIGATNVQGANPLLATVALQYGTDDLIADLLIPQVPVTLLKGNFPTFDRSVGLDGSDDSAGSGSPNTVDDMPHGTDTYDCSDTKSKQAFTGWLTLENQQLPFNELMDTMELLMRQQGLVREVRGALLIDTAANYGANTDTIAASEQWDSHGGGDPFGAIADAKAATWSGNAQTELWAEMSILVWNKIKNHPALLDRIKYVKTGMLTPAMFAELMELDGVAIGGARKRTNRRGATNAYTYVWGKNLSLVRVAKGQKKRNASFAYNFQFKGRRIYVDFTRENSSHPDGAYRTRYAYNEHMKVVAGDTSYHLKDVIA